MHTAPSPANNLARATSTRPLDPARTTTPQPVCSAGFRMEPWRSVERLASDISCSRVIVSRSSSTAFASTPGQHLLDLVQVLTAMLGAPQVDRAAGRRILPPLRRRQYLPRMA